MSLTNWPLLSVADAIDYTLDQVTGGDSSPRTRRLAWYAVRDAYAELPMRRKWTYYVRPFTILSVASQTTGSIAYDYTGGANERMVTLTSTTWPSDVTKYALYVAGKRYTVDTRVSSTIITLAEKDAPTSDIDSGTSYTLVRDTYELPDNLRAVYEVYDTSAPGRMIPVSPGAIMQERRICRTASVPRLYSVFRSERYASSLAIHFAPSTSSAITYQAYGLFWPQPLKVHDYHGIGTVATTSGSATVTGTSTTFTSDMEGAVMRFSATGVTAIPTDIQGEIDKNRISPYAMQRVIKSRESTTSLTLEQDADTTLSGSGYRISSRIDIEPGAMRNAFLRCCEARFATQDRAGFKAREELYEKALAMAQAADQRIQETVPSGPFPSNLADVLASADLTTGGSDTHSAV